MSIEVIRVLFLASQNDEIVKIQIFVAKEVAEYLSNKKRRELARLEDLGNMSVEMQSSEGFVPEHLGVICIDSQGREIKITSS